MRVFGLLICLLTWPLLASAKNLVTQIHDVDYGFNSEDEILIFLSSGDVAKLHQKNRKMIEHLTMHKSYQMKWFDVTMDKDRFLTRLKESEAPSPHLKNFQFNPNALNEDFVPTTIASMDIAKNYFREARYNPKDSQCFNRAMVWTYEWWKKHSLKSKKILIFFSRTYIRRYNFEWWFHIAPMVNIKDGDQVVERVMDVKYTRGPLELVKWANVFLTKDPACPIITRYSDYADYPYTGECFLMRTHMYTYQPSDLQMYEAWGYKKQAFRMDEVKAAYLEAFDEQL